MTRSKENNKSNSESLPCGEVGGASYIDLYNSHHETIKQHSSEVMNAGRDASFAQFEALGFPTTQLENYKYTDLTEALSADYGLNITR
ncbi:Fe-S cluster assembly protein SufD, partial [bacterium]|nr:Fe-S cluster assembly protein SufD [bacterium]